MLFVNTNLSTQDGEMMLTMLATVAQEESRNTSSRIKFSKKLNAEKGRVPNIVYGYDKIIGDYFNLTINDWEADVIRKVYHMYISDGFGASKIARILNEENIRTKRGYRWTQSGICRLLTNRLYTGIVANGKQEIEDFLTGKRVQKPEEEWKIVSRPDLAIVNRDVFEKAQKIRRENQKKFKETGEKHHAKHVFSTLITCQDCGHFFRQTKRTAKSGDKILWVCCGRNVNGTSFCHNKISISEPELLAAIKAYFVSQISNRKNIIHQIIDHFMKRYKVSNQNFQTEKELVKNIATLKKKRQKYLDMFELDVISSQDLKQKTRELNIGINRLEDRLKMLHYQTEQNSEIPHKLSAVFPTMDALINAANVTNELLKQVIDRIDVFPDGQIDIYLKPLSHMNMPETFLFNINRT